MKNIKKYVVAQTEFEAIHCWPGCPFPEVDYLRNPHRHIFHIKVTKQVFDNDREVEIIMLKHQVRQALQSFGKSRPGLDQDSKYFDLGSTSCEDLAEMLINQLDLHSCEVLEDRENGAYLVAE